MDRRPSWRPWQASPFTLGFLLAVSAAVGGVLEHLAQKSQQTASAADLHDTWLLWYGYAPSNSAQEVSRLPFTFDGESDCLSGLSSTQDLQGRFYFLWLVMPSLIAVLLASFWEIVDTEVKRIEPFYQMSRPQGAKASQTLFAQYTSLPSFLTPLQALYWKQWVVLLSALCYVLIGTLTPILQSQLFQTQTQILQVGFTSTGGDFRYFGFPLPDGLNPNHYDTSGMMSFSEYVNAGSQPLSGKCLIVGEDWTGQDLLVKQALESAADMQASDEPFPFGAVRSVAYLDPTICRVQEAVLFIAVALTMGLIWKFLRRRSGMCGSWGNLAALTAVANAYPDFLHAISMTMDLDRARAKRWEKALMNQTVYLGNRRAPTSEVVSGAGISDKAAGYQESAEAQAEAGPYGLYFDSVPTQVVEAPTQRVGVPRHSRRITGASWATIALALAAAALAFVMGVAKNNIGGEALSTAQKSVYPIAALILTAVTKSVWKTVEHSTLAQTALWHRGSVVAAHMYSPFLRAHPTLGREYARMPPFWINAVSTRDMHLRIGLVAFISLLFDVAIFLLGITSTMAQGQGYSSANLANIGFAACALMALAGAFAFAYRKAYVLVLPPLLPGLDPASIAGALALVAQSPALRYDMDPVRTMADEKDRSAYLRSLPGLYAYIQVPARHLTNAYTWSLERLSMEQMHAWGLEPGTTESHQS